MLTVCTWLWQGKPGTPHKYGIDDVLKLHAGVRRHLSRPHVFVCFTNISFVGGTIEQWYGVDMKFSGIKEEDYPLLAIQGCFARLRMFDPDWQIEHNITDRLVCIDLDTVVTGPLDPLFDRPEPFVILKGANSHNPNPMNGSLMMLRPGAHPEVWSDFSLEAASKIQKFEFPDDQGWLWHKLPTAAGWKCGPESGVWSFQKTSWPKGEALPAGARMVVFPGWRSPQKFKHLPWIKNHWNTHDRSVARVPIPTSALERVQN